MHFIGVGKVQLIIVLLRLIFTTYLIPEGSGNRNCQNRLRKPGFSSVDPLDNEGIKNLVIQLSSLGGSKEQERVRGCKGLGKAFSSVQFSSVAQSCPTLCDPMNRSTPGLPVHHQHLKFTQTHVHRVSDAIQPSHPRSSPSPPAPNPSQHQSLMETLFPRMGPPGCMALSFLHPP